MRIPYTTKTIDTYFVTVIIKFEGESRTRKKILPVAGPIKSDTMLINKVRAAYPQYYIVGITAYNHEKALYGMPDQAFISQAEVLDTKTRKPINTITNKKGEKEHV